MNTHALVAPELSSGVQSHGAGPVAVGVQHGARDAGVTGDCTSAIPVAGPGSACTLYGVFGVPIVRKTSAVTVFEPPVPIERLAGAGAGRAARSRTLVKSQDLKMLPSGTIPPLADSAAADPVPRPKPIDPNCGYNDCYEARRSNHSASLCDDSVVLGRDYGGGGSRVAVSVTVPDSGCPPSSAAATRPRWTSAGLQAAGPGRWSARSASYSWSSSWRTSCRCSTACCSTA